MSKPVNNSPALLVLIILYSLAFAQEKPFTFPGERVRLKIFPDLAKSHIGIIDTIDSESLILRKNDQGKSMVIPLASIHSVEISEGQKRHTYTGIRVGGMTGIVAGVIYGFAISRRNETTSSGQDFTTLTTVSTVVTNAGLFGLIGAGAGGILGTLIKSDKWREVSLHHLRVNATTGFILSIHLKL